MIIQDNYIIPEKGKLLHCLYNNKLYKNKIKLDYIWDSNTPHLLTEEDFEEVDESEFECIDNVWYDFRNMSYAAIKTLIIKLHYSNDDQIALMINYQQSPEQYQEAYETMQNWRVYAKEVAKRFTDGSILTPTMV